jgi:hypothetical protein
MARDELKRLCLQDGCEVLVLRGRCTRHRRAAWERDNRQRVNETRRLWKKLRPRANRCFDCGDETNGLRCTPCNARHIGKTYPDKAARQ